MKINGNKILVSVVFVLLILTFILAKLGWGSSGGYSAYKAVLLTDKMSYFGKTKNLNADFLILTDVFYVRAKPVTGKEAPSAAAGFELAKLGSEIHGPEAGMIINREQIVSVQNLKESSQIVSAIRGYYSSREKSK